MKTLNEKNRKERRLERAWRTIMISSAMFMMMVSPVFAATNYVEKGSSWILGMVGSLALLACIFMAVMSAAKKEYSKMAIFIVVGAFLKFITANPNVLTKLGDAIGSSFGLK